MNLETKKKKVQMSNLTVGGLFSGVGGIELGFIKNGFEILWSNDIDKDASITFGLNFKHKHILSDIKEINGKDLESVDVLVGGFPCQAFSIAGYRKGFDDDRGNLFFEIVRLVNELKIKPKVIFLENVKNFYTHDNGNTFKVVCNELNALGYDVLSEVMNTSEYTDIPQNRERTFIVCFNKKLKKQSEKFKEIFPPKKINKTKHIKNFLESEKIDEKFYYRSDRYMYKELVSTITSEDTVYQWRRQYVRENKKNQCPTLTANMGTGGHNVPLIKDKNGIRKLTMRECFNLQGFPKNFKLPKNIANSHLYKQAGNSVTVDMIALIASKIKSVLI